MFYSPELDIEYDVDLEGKDLLLKYGYSDNVVLKSSGPDLFAEAMFEVAFIRDKENRITGFNLSAMDIQNIGFTKTGSPE